MDYDVIIIGGGPAGLTAGIYASRARLKTLVAESVNRPTQAVLTDHIENYPGFPSGINGFELIVNFKNQATRFGAEIITDEVRSIIEHNYGSFSGWKVGLSKREVSCLALIVATGASPRKLGIPGEEKFTGRGVSYCATCDGALYRDKVVVLIGGGDTAIEEAMFLTRFAARVIVVHRRDRLRATKILQERAFSNNKIEFVWNSVPLEIKGDKTVSQLIVKDRNSGKENIISCDGVFVFVGYLPNTSFLKGVVDLDERGYIVTDEVMAASKKGLFACGDCRKKGLRQVVTAVGDGAQAAFSAQQYIAEIKGEAYR